MAQYDQIILFYNQLINLAHDVNELIDKELFDDIMSMLERHDKVLMQIRLAKKCAKLTPEQQSEIERLENELKTLEKNNMEHLQENMKSVRQELDKINMKYRVKNAYGQIAENQGSIINISDSYRPDDNKA